jgi:hypothetical protein
VIIDRTEKIQKELPAKLVNSSEKAWQALFRGNNLSELDKVLFWQAVQIAFLYGQKEGQ